MKKSFTVSELKEKLKDFDDDLEIFVANVDKVQLDGLSALALMKSVKDDKTYVMFIANGDILKI